MAVPTAPPKVRLTKNLIDGNSVEAESGQTFETYNPATGEVLTHVAESGWADKLYGETIPVDGGNNRFFCYNTLDPGAPFGGFKFSGHGRDCGKQALEHYSEVRAVWVNLGER